MSKNSKWVTAGSIAGLLAAAAAVASSPKARKGVTRAASASSVQVKNLIALVRDNREEVVQHLKASGEELSRVVDHASDDVKQLMEASKKMKSHFDEVSRVLQGVNTEWKDLLEEVKEEPKRIDQGDVELEHVPEHGEGPNKL
ncbi:hypothetical protein [Alkalicoccus luteus]|uniref:hypothetical protein n=1 Tax=Alkalicoccus luteus TaxID=1237094 RepID=UPI0040331928